MQGGTHMNTMTSRKHKSIKDLPKGARIAWLIILIMGIAGLTITVLDMTGVFETKTFIGTGLCSIACLSGALLSIKYGDDLYEKE